ncbi:AAA family ATPase [Alphaproteobacteria bacterium]|nr:AAA family ATPase [Alphaproteobacteria bacterium]
MGNFDFLKDEWPLLARIGNQAESYQINDPQSALVKLRCFIEIVVGEVYRDLQLVCDPEWDLFRKINENTFSETVGPVLTKKFHNIRIWGNKGAHNRAYSKAPINELIIEAFQIGSWMFKGKFDLDVAPFSKTEIIFSDDKKPQDATVNIEKLQKDLQQKDRQLQEALNELEKSTNNEKQLQAKVNNLDNDKDTDLANRFKNIAKQNNKMLEQLSKTSPSMEDIFSGYNLTMDQQKAVELLSNFLTHKSDNVFLLKGFAGTGKTFVLRGITEYLSAQGRNYVLAAPTGKASKVISQKTGCEAFTIHKSIYSMKDIKEYTVDEDDGTQTYKFYAELRVNTDSVDTVYILDEASMISNKYQEEEFFRFGSGKLLQDLLQFINADHNDHKKKIIFIGDSAQLPPVGMQSSPALSEKNLQQILNVQPKVFEMKQVVRQKEDSGILEKSLQLREAIQKNNFYQLAIKANTKDVIKIEHSEFMRHYLKSCNGKINADSIVIAHSNASVAEYNTTIREHFFPGQESICPGDKVMAVSNNYRSGHMISNGDFGLVKEVEGGKETRTIVLKKKNAETNNVEETSINLNFCKIYLGFKDISGKPFFFETYTLENLLLSKQPDLSSEEKRALYIDFRNRNRTLRPGSKEFSDSLKADPYFNALKLKFGYAITCHKAQGSEWNNVFVNCMSNQSVLTENYFRWLYTAITRASKSLYLLDPPEINSGSQMKRVGGASATLSSTSGKFISPNTRPSNYDLDNISHLLQNEPRDPDFDKFDIEPDDQFRLSLLSAINKILEGTDIKVGGITHKNYLENYFFERDDATASINIYYKSSLTISNITPTTQTKFSLEVQKILAPVIGKSFNEIETALDEISFQEKFQVDFHKILLSATSKYQINIKRIEPFQWSQRYYFTHLEDETCFEFYFNAKKVFTKYAHVKNLCKSATLREKIYNLLDELQST